MDRQSRERLQLDRRLIRRRGHISQEELERALAALPDVAEKAVAIEFDAPAGKPPPESEKR